MDSSLIRARARENIRLNWGASIAAALMAALLGGLLTGSGFGSINIDEELMYELPPVVISLLLAWSSVAGILGLAQAILGGTIQLGYCRFLLGQHDRREYTFNDLFSQFDRFGTGFAQKFLRGLYTTLWGLLFIIPGIVKGYSYAMTPFILTDHPELTASQAIDASKKMMDGHKGELFWLDLSFIGWDILCALTLGIGSLWLNPYKNAAYAAFYRQLQAEQRYTLVE